MCHFWGKVFFFSQKVNVLPPAEGCTVVFDSAEMGIGFWRLVFYTVGGIIVPNHIYSSHPRTDPRCAGISVTLLCRNSFSVPESWGSNYNVTAGFFFPPSSSTRNVMAFLSIAWFSQQNLIKSEMLKIRLCQKNWKLEESAKLLTGTKGNPAVGISSSVNTDTAVGAGCLCEVVGFLVPSV